MPRRRDLLYQAAAPSWERVAADDSGSLAWLGFRPYTPTPQAPIVHKPEPLDDNDYSLRDVSRHYDWEGFDPYEIEHLVHNPERARFTLENVPVDSLRHVDEKGNLIRPWSYDQIADQDEDERERLEGLEQGYRQGANIPPAVVVRDGPYHIIADGSHRAAVHERNGESHMPAFVTERTIFPQRHEASQRVAAAEVQHQGDSPLDYSSVWRGDQPERLAVVDPEAGEPPQNDSYFAGHAKSNIEAAAPGTVAFLDYSRWRPDSVYVHYMTTRRDQQGQGHQRRLVEGLLARHPEVSNIDFGDEYEPQVTHLRKSLQEAHPDKYFRGKIQYFGAVASANSEGFPNTYHGNPEFGGNPDFSHTWFHGTKGTPQFGERRGQGDFAQRLGLPPDERVKGSGWPQPNQMMGVHFSPLHEVAHKFAWGSKPSAIVHARLNFDNPAHYPTEKHLNYAVADWASKNFPEWHNEKLNANRAWNYSDNEGTHADFSQVPGGWGDRAQDVLQWHPYLPEIIKGFHQHLADQGHHGITYGNGVEGPYITDIITGGDHRAKGRPNPLADWPSALPHSISAIAQPEDIQIKGIEHIAPAQERPAPGQVSWEGASALDEPDEMKDRVLDYHREHGGAYPQRSMQHEAAWDDNRDARSDRWYDFRNRSQPGALHRGVYAPLDSDIHEYVHDETVPIADRARVLLNNAHPYGDWGLGMHWTPHVHIAERSINNAADEQRSAGDLDEDWDDDYSEGENGEGTHADVIFHIRQPAQRSVVRDPKLLEQRSVGWQYSKDEDETPIKPGAPVFVTGVSWRPHDPEHPREPFEHYDFPKPVRHEAAAPEDMRALLERVLPEGSRFGTTHPEVAAALEKHFNYTEPSGVTSKLTQHSIMGGPDSVYGPGRWRVGFGGRFSAPDGRDAGRWDGELNLSDDDPHAYLGNVGVHPEAERQGIAGRWTQRFHDAMKAMGAKRFFLMDLSRGSDPTGEGRSYWSQHGYNPPTYDRETPGSSFWTREAVAPSWEHVASAPLTWDEIGERHPHIYGDPGVHGEEADGADGEGIGWAAAQLAFERPGHEEPDEGSYDLDFHLKDVPVSQIDFARHGAGDSRVESARRWYRQGVDKVVPPVLVHRHGVYQVADGHHRGEAAYLEGKETIPAYVAQSPYENEPFDEEGRRGPYHGADVMQHEAATKKKPKPKKPRKPEEVWYDVHKHPEGTPGGMGKSPEHHLRNRGWQPHEIHGAGSKTIQYMNHKFPDFVISYGGASSTKPDHNFRVLYIGGNRNVPKVTRAYSVAEAMNKVEELHQLQSGLVVMPMTHSAGVDDNTIDRGPYDPSFDMPDNHRAWLEARGWKRRTEPVEGETFAPHYTKMTPSGIRHSLYWDGQKAWFHNKPIYQLESSVPDKHNSWRSIVPPGEQPVFESSDLGEIARRARGNEFAWLTGERDKSRNPGLLRYMRPEDDEYDRRFWDEPVAEGPANEGMEFGEYREPKENLHPLWRGGPGGLSGLHRLNSTAVPHTVNNPPTIKDPRQFLAPNQPKKPPITAPTYPIGPKPVKEFTEQPEAQEPEVQENKPQLNQIPDTPGPTQRSQFKWHSSVADSWEDDHYRPDPVFELVDE